MTWLAESLWELLAKQNKRKPAAAKPADDAVAQAPVRNDAQKTTKKPLATGAKKPKLTMQQRYDALVEEMKRTYGVRVRKWRKSSSGVAWTVRYVETGRVVKLIESPYPRGPMSCAIFLHEIGHHAIGLGVYRPRCLEEYVVWVWALDTMRAKGFNVTPAVERRMEESMRYAVRKAMRRGMKRVPPELLRYV